MIGIFDSGDGGIFALREIRRQIPNADVVFFADRENSPYGTKSRRQIMRLTAKGISKLLDAGADKVLIACCTASTVYDFLPQNVREKSIPIIHPTAKEAALSTENGKIGVIATRATTLSRAFSRTLGSFDNVNEVHELCLQELVDTVESGCRDGNMTPSEREWLYRKLLPLKESNADTLILGCTHFGHLEREISNLMPRVKIISSAKIGVKEIIKSSSPQGRGKTIYL